MCTIYNKVILIDDDKVINHLNKITIIKFLRPHPIDIIEFQNAELGFSYIAGMDKCLRTSTVLFLDLNMPILNGWEFLEKLDKFSFRNPLTMDIYVLTSSIDPADKVRAKGYFLVKDFISKPLSNHIGKIFTLNKETQQQNVFVETKK